MAKEQRSTLPATLLKLGGLGVVAALGLFYGPVYVEYARMRWLVTQAGEQCRKVNAMPPDQRPAARNDCIHTLSVYAAKILGPEIPVAVQLGADDSGGVQVVCDYDRPASLLGFRRTFHFHFEAVGRPED